MLLNDLHGRNNQCDDLPTLHAMPQRPRAQDGLDKVTRHLNLLDLPLDVLQCVVSHVSHTNDLTSMALVHSVMHQLVIPHIYSRFDIVWPEANLPAETRVGVDALTYGLATLVMAHDVLGECTPPGSSCVGCQYCQEKAAQNYKLQSKKLPTRVRRGNYFAKHVRKFSLGNGPMEWVADYLITREGGKMLGTLAALAVGRMRNLESFVWDMPTGVIRDIWLALGSLASRQDGQQCRLEKVWVRWHDNRDSFHVPMSTNSSLPRLLSSSSKFHIPAYPSVEFPSFSVLPPLSSISVLDIDEVSYAEELSLLLERSKDKLRELRIGIAHHAQRNVPFRPVEDRMVVSLPALADGEERRPGGILGILFHRLCPARDSRLGQSVVETRPSTELAAQMCCSEQMTQPDSQTSSTDSVEELSHLLAEQQLHEPTNVGRQAETPASEDCRSLKTHNLPNGRLQLQTLELERIHLVMPVLSRAVDWSRLESLTLLGCINHEQLWKALRDTFTPTSVRKRSAAYTSGLTACRGRSSSFLLNSTNASEFKLKLCRLHLDTVSKAFLHFVRDALAPNTLEWLFLQETIAYRSSVTIDDIYRHAIRRHRYSLRKLLIDSAIKDKTHSEESDSSWQRWTDFKELITCITNSKTRLREVSIAIDYKHWHYLLQRLPNATNLRSLHVSHIAKYPFNGGHVEPKEAALQILNIVALRPELQLCYLGLENKCFEILECKADASRRDSDLTGNRGHNGATVGATTHNVGENDEEDGSDEDASFYQGSHVAAANPSDYENQTSDSGSQRTSNDTDDEDTEADEAEEQKVFDLREILFYDDKVSIFKARHGRL